MKLIMHRIITQLTTNATYIPAESLLRKWAKMALKNKIAAAEVTIRIVTPEEMLALNSTYRHKRKPTNVLSFPFEMPKEVTMDMPILGDIVICADVVNQEAFEQTKSKEAHWAHMVVHGIFHLLGLDHETEEDASIMETLEINILKELGFPNPYH